MERLSSEEYVKSPQSIKKCWKIKMAAPPAPLDTQFDPNTMTWSGPPETHDKSQQIGEYVLNILKNAPNQDKIIQVTHHCIRVFVYKGRYQ